MKRICIRFVLLTVVLLSAASPMTRAQVPVSGILYLVTTLDDHDDFSCDTDCTLREAIDIANAHSGADGIRIGVSGTINLASALPPIADTLIITGPGPDLLTVRRNAADTYRIFMVTATGKVTLSGMTIANGLAIPNCSFENSDAACRGGGIYNGTGTLNLTNCKLDGNNATHGGGVFNNGTLNVTNSKFTGNSSVYFGGGILNLGTVNITDSFFYNNSTARGGAIAGFENSSTQIISSTFAANPVRASGGAIFGEKGVLNIYNSTFIGNTIPQAGGEGGGAIRWNQGSMRLTNSTVAGNSSNGAAVDLHSSSATVISNIIAANTVNGGSEQDVFSSPVVVSAGYNLIGVLSNGIDGFSPTSTDLTGTVTSPLDPKFDPSGLRDNGGPTLTIGLQTISPAVDKGFSYGLLTDQRGPGFVRTFDTNVANADGGDGTDIGAFEIQATSVAIVSTVVQTLPDNDFRVPGNKNATLSRLQDIKQSITAGYVDQAIQDLKNLRKRVDGCGPSSLTDNDDWITNCTSQVHVRALIDKLIVNPVP